MIDSPPSSLLRRMHHYDSSLCVLFNRISRYRRVGRVFAVISRLGDGIAWYVLTLLLPVIYGLRAIHTSLHMVVVGLSGVTLYKILKSGTERPRPYQIMKEIRLGAAPLDRFSFPSGHTLHAVAFSTVVIVDHPELVWLLAPFTVLIALSRMVLGLHYPTDVLAGVVTGLLVAIGSLAFI